LALILVIVMAAGPLLRWRRDEFRALARRLVVPAIVTVAALAAVLAALPRANLLPSLGLILAAGVGVASVAPLWKRNLRRTPLFTWGMVIAHLGIAVSLAGMASESAFTKETLVAARPGEVHRVGPFAVRFDGVEPIAGPNWTALEATLTASRGGGTPMEMRPQARAFWTPPTETSEAAIRTLWDGQLYTVLGKQADDGRWQLRLWWKPFVTLIWAGGALIAIGGMLSLIGRVLRDRRAAQRGKEEWE
jgi:cytochrome c-type biogenesis protein CcmF